MVEGIPRLLLALAVIVAVGTISLGIKDHFQQKNAKSTSTPTADQSDAIVGPKKLSDKTRASRISSAQANVRARAQAHDDVEKPIIRGLSGRASQAAQGEAAAMNEHNLVPNGREGKPPRPASSGAHCLPLPNTTNLTDVDASYYRNWAREYSCYDSIPSAAAKPKLR